LKDYRGPKNKKKPKHHKNIAGSTYWLTIVREFRSTKW
jgi:hypothetical protein